MAVFQQKYTIMKWVITTGLLISEAAREGNQMVRVPENIERVRKECL